MSIFFIFAVGGIIIALHVQEASRKTNAFISENWPTADLIMETQIAFDAIAKKALHFQGDLDPEVFVEESQARLSQFRTHFESAPLPVADRKRVAALLADAEQALVSPVLLAPVPGLNMEAADAAVHPVLEKVNTLGESEMINLLWEAVMAFNDILITGDSAERTRFNHLIAKIESHAVFSEIAEDYRPFKARALKVFDSALRLKEARNRFLAAGDSLAEALRELESRYEEN